MLTVHVALVYPAPECGLRCIGREQRSIMLVLCGLQAQSAKLIGQAIQNNPAFLTLRKIEVRRVPCCRHSLVAVTLLGSAFNFDPSHSCNGCSIEHGCAVQAAREIANTVAGSQNRVFLNSDSLLLNLVSILPKHSTWHHIGCNALPRTFTSHRGNHIVLL